MDQSALENSIKTLERSLDSLGGWLSFWTFLVVLGLIVEYWHHVKELVVKRPFDWRLLQTIIGGTQITVGVAGELFIQVKASGIEGELRDKNHQALAFLDKEAAGALERAAKAEENLGIARKDAATANERAAEANRIAEEDRLARVRIEEKIAWRTMSVGKQRTIVAKLKRFSGQPFTIRTFPDDDEAVNLAEIMLKLLLDAGWNRKETSHVMAFVHLDGVSVEVAPSRAIDFEPAAKALASALSGAGIDTVEKTNPGEEHDDHASMIHIRIGKKPPRN